jgi:hypothetical protein
MTSNSLSSDDMDRLDGFDIDCTPKDILHRLMIDAGGDPMVALTKLIERAIDTEDELDSARLMLDEYRKKEGAAPLVLDAERRSEHQRARLALQVALGNQDANGDVDEYSKEDLDYLHDMGLEDFEEDEAPVAAPSRDRRDPERCPQLHIIK